MVKEEMRDRADSRMNELELALQRNCIFCQAKTMEPDRFSVVAVGFECSQCGHRVIYTNDQFKERTGRDFSCGKSYNSKCIHCVKNEQK
jgi:hypothetical protein